jgi:hypothetical protein
MAGKVAASIQQSSRSMARIAWASPYPPAVS